MLGSERGDRAARDRVVPTYRQHERLAPVGRLAVRGTLHVLEDGAEPGAHDILVDDVGPPGRAGRRARSRRDPAKVYIAHVFEAVPERANRLWKARLTECVWRLLSAAEVLALGPGRADEAHDRAARAISGR